jgi:hypothetical protein
VQIISDIKTEKITPPIESILQNQGVPEDAELTQSVADILKQAYDIFSLLCEPKTIISEITISQFSVVYNGSGRNEIETPVEIIYPQAKILELFAVTLGEELSDKIQELFQSSDFALGSMLDSLASEATELAGLFIENEQMKKLRDNNKITKKDAVVRYSPGYCGWHLSGQKKLFEYLIPEKIGITLNSSFLMKPIKSISGVMIIGNRRIHQFVPSYPFCRDCQAPSCLSRMKVIMEQDFGLHQEL